MYSDRAHFKGAAPSIVKSKGGFPLTSSSRDGGEKISSRGPLWYKQ